MVELLPDFTRLLSLGLLLLIPLFLIYKKAGFSPYWSLLVFIPLGLLLIFIHLAFFDWPNAKEFEEDA